MVRIYVHVDGKTSQPDRVDPAWLAPGSGAVLWVDLMNPSQDEGLRILRDVFHFHELALEDALSELEYPKVESYGTYLYLILHRIVDAMIDNYRPELDELTDRLDDLEQRVFDGNANLAKDILNFKKDVASLRRVVQPQRDVVGRLARREFPFIDEQISYRFRDVHDHLVRIADESMFFQDRITSLLDANLAIVSNQLNTIMKILTIIATVFMPLTFITGLYGMNVDLPHFGFGGVTMFWVLMGIMAGIVAFMLVYFRRRGWI